MVERSGAGRLVFSVAVRNGAVVCESMGTSLYGISLPSALAPHATGAVTATEDGWQVDVEVSSPVFGLLCAYRARLTRT